MAPFLIPPHILAKIRQAHGVEEDEVREAFFNREYEFSPERREQHEREYRKIWFIAETDLGRLLKVVLAELKDDDQLVLMSAYDPNDEDIKKYENEIKSAEANRKRQ